MGLFRRKRVNRRIVQQAPVRSLPVRGIVQALLFVGAATVLTWGAAHLTDPRVLPVRYVEIRGGLHHVTSARIRDRVKAAVKGNFITADTGAVQRSLEALPWVRQAMITRVWPDTLEVAVVEQRALARWGSEALVNPAGRLFHPVADAGRAALPVLDGPPDDVPAVVEHYKAAALRLRTLGLDVQRLTLDRRHAWRLRLSNGIDLVLGQHDYDGRLQRFTRYYTRVLGRRAGDIASVDLRYSNGFAVHWRGAPGA